MKRETDLATCKAALNGLRSDTGMEEGKKLPALTDEALSALAAVVPLSPADADEIRGAPFTDHDAVYLTDCFYLRDVARSLALAGVPPQRQAELAFEWVCRQVYLQPWLFRAGAKTFVATALPPTAVLRRGFGSGLERMYVFLALLQQLELDGCLIGAPVLPPRELVLPVNGAVPDTPEALAAVAAAAPRGPFWAVGVRVGSDVRLFDPWRGLPLPWTLAQLRANPDAAKAWFEDKANVSGATLEDAKRATAHLAVPVNALSARMGAFDSHLKAELGVRVSIDPTALRAGFPDPKPAFWNPPDDPFTYGRTARSYLPVEQGGADRTPQDAARLYESSLRDQIPRAEFPSDLKLGARGEVGESAIRQRLELVVRGTLGVVFVEPPNPRERIQRGQFHDVARDLVAKQETFAAGLERLRNNKDTSKLTKEWIQKALDLYAELRQTQTIARYKSEESAALEAVEMHWKEVGAHLLMDQATAEVGQAEAAMLLALCKHEQAERVQVRVERATSAEAARLKPDAVAAWETALSAWKTYEQSAGAHAAFPGRSAHARALEARAAKFVELDSKP
jgi:hypothetical protein